MFWDKVSNFYDLFETVYNGKVYRGLGEKVSEEIDENDVVLECACGTGAISKYGKKLLLMLEQPSGLATARKTSKGGHPNESKSE